MQQERSGQREGRWNAVGSDSYGIGSHPRRVTARPLLGMIRGASARVAPKSQQSNPMSYQAGPCSETTETKHEATDARPKDRSFVVRGAHPRGTRRLERDDLVGRIAAERRVQIGVAAHAHALDHVARLVLAVADGCRQPTLGGALVAEHQQHPALAGDLAQPLADGVALAQDVGVVVEEEHADDLGAVPALFELRKDHLAELVAGGVAARRENVRNLHIAPPYRAPARRASRADTPREVYRTEMAPAQGEPAGMLAQGWRPLPGVGPYCVASS